VCLALVALDSHPRFALVVAANRDEYHARPTAAAQWWPAGILAGRDLAAGGTWLGVSRSGRFALLTNVRDPSRHDATAPSRGALVVDVLTRRAPLFDVLEGLRRGGQRHNGFNLLAGNPSELGWTSNRAQATRMLGRGLYGLSNDALDVPWPKVTRTRRALEAWTAAAREDVEPLFEALGDRTPARDEELPSTGVGIARERLLSAPFIVDPHYGTRSTTVVTIAHDGAARFIERAFDARGEVTGEVDHRFEIERATV
jgi:uncharacterized protein with NRDE domain